MRTQANDFERVAQANFADPDWYLADRFMLRHRVEILGELLEGISGARMLDVGAGDGSVSEFLDGAYNQRVLVDASDGMIRRSIARATERGLEVEAHRITLEGFTDPDRFDLVLAIGLLAHVGNLPRALEKLAAQVKPGGRLVIQFTDADQLTGRILRWWYGRRGTYTAQRTSWREIESVMTGFGLRLHGIRRYSLMLPGMGSLSGSFLSRYLTLVARSPSLSALATDVMAVWLRPVEVDTAGDSAGVARSA